MNVVVAAARTGQASAFSRTATPAGARVAPELRSKLAYRPPFHEPLCSTFHYLQQTTGLPFPFMPSCGSGESITRSVTS
jgi:hypothetical protein